MNRRHVRIKVMQALYSYENTEKGTYTLAEVQRFLTQSSDRLIDLYLYIFLFIEELGHYSLRYEEDMKAKFIQENSIDKKAGQKFWLNPVLQAIIENPEFHKELRKRNIVFSGDEDVLKRIYLDLKNQDVYLESVNLVEHNPNIALEVITFILKNYTNNFAILQGHLEETYYNWADDKKIVIQLAIKSIQNFILKKKNSFLITDLMDQEVEQFAKDLLTLNIEKREHLDSILIPKLTKWEPSQIAMLDYIVLRMAITEFLYFPTIPSLVTINEYIDLTKTYSTPQSKKLINGVLDFVYDEIVKEGIVKKDEFPRKK